MKNSNDIVGNRTRDLPACSAVPQPTAPPRVRRKGTMEIRRMFSPGWVRCAWSHERCKVIVTEWAGYIYAVY